MTTIKKYTKKDGSTAYMFNAYLGVDELTGKKKRTTRRGFRTVKDAKLALAKIQLDLDNNTYTAQSFNTFEEIYNQWFSSHKLNVKASTAQRIEACKKIILEEFGKYKINKITSIQCQNVIDKWASTSKSYKKLISYTKIVFKYAKNHSLINENPMDRITMPKRKQEFNLNKENFLDKQQLKEFLKFIKKNEKMKPYVMFHLLAYTGMRKGELCSLNWSDIDFDNSIISINKSIMEVSKNRTISSTKTESSNRDISIDLSTIKLLKRWKLEQRKILLSRGIRVNIDEKQLVFSSENNKLIHVAYLNRILYRHPQFEITVHGFRHTHASLLFESGANIKQVQQRLGHSDVQTTLNIYAHVTKDFEKETATNFLKFMES